MAGANAIAGNDADAPSNEGNSDSAPAGKDSRGDGVRVPTRNPPSHEGTSSSKGSLAPWDPSRDDEDLTERDLTEPDREEPRDDEGAIDEEGPGTPALKASPESADDRDEETLDQSDGAEESEGVDGD